jgi:hypothetical protein
MLDGAGGLADTRRDGVRGDGFTRSTSSKEAANDRPAKHIESANTAPRLDLMTDLPIL